MAHLKKSASTGHLLKAATGHLSIACGASCGGCTGSKPSYITVTISGTSACSGCLVYSVVSPGGGGSNISINSISGNVDGTYDVPFYSGDANTCLYYADFPCNITLDIYDNTSCNAPGLLGTITLTNFSLQVKFSYEPISGHYNLFINAGFDYYDSLTSQLLNFQFASYDSDGSTDSGPNPPVTGPCSQGEGTFASVYTGSFGCHDYLSPFLNGGLLNNGGTITTTFH